MKYSRSQVAPAHASAGRRPGHQALHAPGRSGTLPVQAPGPAQATGGVETGTESSAGFIPDLATGAKSLTDSLEILTRTASETLGSLMESSVECGMVLKRAKNMPAIAGTTAATIRLARLDQETGEGPLTEALAGNGTVAMNHVPSDFRWARFRPHLQDAGLDSVLGLRLPLDGGAEAALAFFAPEVQAFPLQVIAAARDFADLAARGLKLVLELQTTSTRASDLQSALESRTSIDIACGVIMAQNRCSYDDAIAIIARASSHRNLKLRKVAEGILENLPGGAPRTHFEH